MTEAAAIVEEAAVTEAAAIAEEAAVTDAAAIAEEVAVRAEAAVAYEATIVVQQAAAVGHDATRLSIPIAVHLAGLVPAFDSRIVDFPAIDTFATSAWIVRLGDVES